MEYISVKEAASRLSVSPETLRQYAAAGKLEGHIEYEKTPGGHRKYLALDVDNVAKAGGLEKLIYIKKVKKDDSNLDKKVVVSQGRRDRYLIDLRKAILSHVAIMICIGVLIALIPDLGGPFYLCKVAGFFLGTFVLMRLTLIMFEITRIMFLTEKQWNSYAARKKIYN